jgi:hypothetical protein
MKKIIKKMLLGIGILLVLFICYFAVIKSMDSKAMEQKDFHAVSYNTKDPILLPSLFIDSARFYFKMTAGNGDTILAFGDTGGGISMMMPAAVDNLSLRPKIKRGLLRGIMPLKYILFNNVVSNRAIPPPLPLRSMILRRPLKQVRESILIIPAVDEELQSLMKSAPCDIFLGQNFFMNRAWTFDYVHNQIWVNTPLQDGEDTPGVQKIGFRKNKNNQSIFGHPSMTIEVDNEVIDVLFDTGATIALSENGKKSMNISSDGIAGSFIAASIFDKWRKDHPEWKYYEKADMANDIIEVPIVKIGGQEAGPVLFSKRPDEAWSKNMIHSMDKVVKGAIGGSALRYFKVTIDYNSELIKFEKPL